jgi:mono/diheme cytochrome c family protein
MPGHEPGPPGPVSQSTVPFLHPTPIRLRRLLVPLGVLLVAGCESAAPEEQNAVDRAAETVAPVDAQVLASLPPGASVDQLEQGRQLFAVCTVCHGADAAGTQLGPSLRGPEWIRIEGSVEEIQQIVRDGVPSPARYPVPMPQGGGGDFDDQELRALATYVFALRQGAS